MRSPDRLRWLALSITLGACTSPRAAERPAACDEQDTTLPEIVERWRGEAPNALLAVKNGACGTSVYVAGDAATATRDALWRILSVTKTFTSAAILSLVQDGELALDDPATAHWTATGSMHVERTGHTSALLLDGLGLVAGGWAFGKDEAVCGPQHGAELYDWRSGTWAVTRSMFVARRGGHTATLLGNGRVLVTGGRSDPGATASAELYDPTIGMWRSTGKMGAARADHTATLLPSGHVLVAGGVDGSSTTPSVHADSELYDLATRQWTPAGEMTRPRCGHAAVLLAAGSVLVAGGDVPGRGEMSAERYRYLDVQPVNARTTTLSGNACMCLCDRATANDACTRGGDRCSGSATCVARQVCAADSVCCPADSGHRRRTRARRPPRRSPRRAAAGPS